MICQTHIPISLILVLSSCSSADASFPIFYCALDKEPMIFDASIPTFAAKKPLPSIIMCFKKKYLFVTKPAKNHAHHRVPQRTMSRISKILFTHQFSKCRTFLLPGIARILQRVPSLMNNTQIRAISFPLLAHQATEGSASPQLSWRMRRSSS